MTAHRPPCPGSRCTLSGRSVIPLSVCLSRAKPMFELCFSDSAPPYLALSDRSKPLPQRSGKPCDQPVGLCLDGSWLLYYHKEEACQLIGALHCAHLPRQVHATAARRVRSPA